MKNYYHRQSSKRYQELNRQWHLEIGFIMSKWRTLDLVKRVIKRAKGKKYILQTCCGKDARLASFHSVCNSEMEGFLFVCFRSRIILIQAFGIAACTLLLKLYEYFCMNIYISFSTHLHTLQEIGHSNIETHFLLEHISYIPFTSISINWSISLDILISCSHFSDLMWLRSIQIDFYCSYYSSIDRNRFILVQFTDVV